MGGVEPSLKFQLPSLRFGSEGVLKIWRKRLTILNQLMSDGGVCRTAPATPGLFNIPLGLAALGKGYDNF